MSPNLRPPKRGDFTPLISGISELLQPDLEDRIRNELTSPPTVSDEPVNQKRAVSIRESLGAVVRNMGKARKDLNAIIAFFDAAEEHAAQQLKYYTTFKAYVKRTTDQCALQSELLAPIRRLPNEIFQLIFLEVHAQSTEKERYNPITAQVCKFWRQLAHTNTFLWTSINVNLREGEGAMGAVDQLEERIERAKGQLVSVQLSVKERSSSSMARSRNHPFTSAIKILLKYKDKIASLCIPRHDDKLGGDLAKKCEKEKTIFKNLRTLSLYGTEFVSNFKPKPIFQACPNLKRLCISAIPDTAGIPWESIEEFKGPRALKAEWLSEFLARARNIKQAEILSFAWNTLPTITLANSLTALVLGSLLEDCAASLASAPPPSSLRYLSIATPYQPLMISWGSALEFLAIPLDTTEEKDLQPALSATPNLQGLRICDERGLPPNLFTLLPKLTHLEFRTGYDSKSEESVREILSRPLHPKSRGKRLPLRSVTFLPYPVPGRDEDIRLWNCLHQDLNDVGIKVHDYRTVEDPDVYPFKTPFFAERGWGV